MKKFVKVVSILSLSAVLGSVGLVGSANTFPLTVSAQETQVDAGNAVLITKVLDSGEVGYAVRIELPSPAKYDSILTANFSVFSVYSQRNISNAYVNTSGNVGEKEETGQYLFLELNTKDNNASTFEFDVSTFLNIRKHTNYTLVQHQPVTLADGSSFQYEKTDLLAVENVDLASYEHATYQGENEEIVYYHYQPTAETEEKKALILFMHGSGERGEDNMMQLIGSDGPATFASARFQMTIPSYVIAPQSPWDENLQGWNTPGRTEDVASLVRQYLQDHDDIDPNRVYVTGMSNGGLATYKLLFENPDLFAAAIPICGYNVTEEGTRGAMSENQIATFVKIPMWIVHAEDDATVPVTASRDIYQSLLDAGAENVQYTEYGAGVIAHNAHASWEPAYNDYRIFRWLAQQVKE